MAATRAAVAWLSDWIRVHKYDSSQLSSFGQHRVQYVQHALDQDCCPSQSRVCGSHRRGESGRSEARFLGNSFAAVLMRHTRSAMLQAMSSDYVRTARAKGLAERAVVLDPIGNSVELAAMKASQVATD